jgi:phosphoribosylformimino-5-aminoimidazole carboxamide ribotide isomerase
MRALPLLESSMHCIPVLDLLNGVVVRGVRGERAAYQPLVSTVVESSAPLRVAAALHTLFASRRFYIADLDAIQGLGSNAAVVRALAERYPDCEFWVDAGLTTRKAFAAYCPASNLRWVLGSESLATLDAYRALAAAGPRDFVLSLDSRNGEPLGPAELWSEPTLWPPTLIAMNLARVGASEGPDFDLLAALRARSPDTTLVAAGGTRHVDDLHALARLGVQQVLIASALHDGAITPQDLAQW